LYPTQIQVIPTINNDFSTDKMQNIPRDVVRYDILTYQPLEDLYQQAEIDPSLIPILKDETRRRIATLEPLEVVQRHSDVDMLGYLFQVGNSATIIQQLASIYDAQLDMDNGFPIAKYVIQKFDPSYDVLITRGPYIARPLIRSLEQFLLRSEVGFLRNKEGPWDDLIIQSPLGIFSNTLLSMKVVSSNAFNKKLSKEYKELLEAQESMYGNISM